MERARELGADYVINHYQQKISEEVRKLTNKEGVDIVIEHVGSRDLGREHEIVSSPRARS